MPGTSQAPKCAACAQTATSLSKPLQRCGRCLSTYYCSPECQRADWKRHKQTCTNQSTPRPQDAPRSSRPQAPPLSNGLLQPIRRPFHQLEARTWLHNRPEPDVFKLLIDAYRFRMHDNYTLEGHADADGIYGGASSGLPGFQRFVRRAQVLGNLLPRWWSAQKAVECEMVGAENNSWSSLQRKLEKGEVCTHYNDQYMPMQLRMFGEQVYGTGPGGQPGAVMRRQMMRMEGGELGNNVSIIDVSGSSR
jgi:splicing suppressor protein 51